jgi:site-specific recombinase XerD
MSVDVLLTRHALSARAAGSSPKTVSHVNLGVRLFDDFMGGIKDVRKVKADDLRRFIVALQQRPKWQGMKQENGEKISATAVNTYTRAVRSFWSWLKRESIIKSNPLATVPAPKVGKRLPKVFNESELKRILKVASQNDRDYALISLIVDSGIRLDELVGLTPDDVESDRVKVIGKGDKQRYAPISKDTKLAVDLYCSTERPESVADNRLFLRQDGYPLTIGRVQKILEKIGKHAGISQRLSPHKLRHSFATLSLKYGSNLEYLRRTLGHTDIKSTEIYLDVVDADLAAAHKKTSPIVNLHLGKPEVKKVGYKAGDPVKEWRIKDKGKSYRLITPPSVEDVVIPPDEEETVYVIPSK